MRPLCPKLAIALLVACTSSAAAGQGYYGNKDRGWFWYEPDPVEALLPEPEPAPLPPLKEPPPQVVTLAPPQVPEPPPGPAPLSSAWLKANLEKYQFMAMDNPTVDNVAAYLYLQRLMVDKSSAFAESGQVAVAMYPELSNESRRPRTQAAAQAMSRRASDAQKAVFEKVTKGGTLSFVFDSRCGDICMPQFAALRTFSVNADANVEYLSVDGKLPDGVQIDGNYVNPKRVKALGARQVPSLYLTTAAGEVVHLSSAIMPFDVMAQSVVAIAYGKGWISHAEYETTRGRENYSIRVAQDEEVPPEVLDDPVKLTVFLRDRLLKE